MTFVYAEYARRTENMTDAEVTGEIMFHLKICTAMVFPIRRICCGLMAVQYKLLWILFLSGCRNSNAIFNDLAVEVNNKLFFAGEHTEIDYFSTAHGAYI